MFMISQPPPEAPIHDDRHGRILAEMAGMGLEIARDLRERALAAETAEEAVRLARAFHTVSRGVRQSLALELKVISFRNALHREVAEAEAQARAAEAAARAPRVDRRREEIGSRVEQLIYTEYEGYEDAPYEDPRAQRLQWALSDWMEAASARPDFFTADLDAQILDACRTLGLDPARFAELDAAERRARHGDDDGEDEDEDYDEGEDDDAEPVRDAEYETDRAGDAAAGPDAARTPAFADSG
jgi:N-methylhydantoinase A/oxoprolinase/acetone carboxylase beta subunit